MKKNSKDVSFGKRVAHFIKHYSGYVFLALICAAITVMIIGFCADVTLPTP